MEEKKKNSWLPIVGGIALIVVLFLLIKLIFAGLDQAIAQDGSDVGTTVSQSQSQSQPPEGSSEYQTPEFCPFCGEKLHDSFQWGQFCPFCGEKVEE